MSKQAGFTFIELMLVVAIIGLLAATAIPSYTKYLKQTYVVEGFNISRAATTAVADYYSHHGRLPKNNAAAGLPPAQGLSGEYVEGVEVADGAVHIQYRRDLFEDDKRMLSLRPALSAAVPPPPFITWLCADSEAVPGMLPQGENRSTIDVSYLPDACNQR